MNYLLISGPPDTGKTDSIFDIASELVANRNFVPVAGNFNPVRPAPPARVDDFLCVLQGVDNTGKLITVLVNSATDTAEIIAALRNFYQLHSGVDFVITSSRQEGDPMRDELFLQLNIAAPKDVLVDMPRGRMISGYSRVRAIPWYHNTMNTLILRVLQWPPFNL